MPCLQEGMGKAELFAGASLRISVSPETQWGGGGRRHPNIGRCPSAPASVSQTGIIPPWFEPPARRLPPRAQNQATNVLGALLGPRSGSAGALPGLQPHTQAYAAL